MWKYFIDLYAIPIGYYLVEACAYVFVVLYEALGIQYKRFEGVGLKPTMFAKTKNTFDLALL